MWQVRLRNSIFNLLNFLLISISVAISGSQLCIGQCNPKAYFLSFLNNCIYLFSLCGISVAACRLSLVATSGLVGLSSWASLGVWASLVTEHGLQGARASVVVGLGWGTRASVVARGLQLLWFTGLVAPQHVESPQTRG